MSQKDGFIDSLKHMVFEDEPEQQKPTTASINASAATAATMAPIYSQTTASVPDNDEAYHRILSKTDFDATEAGATIQKFLQPLANLPMDAALKFKTAVAQAKAQNGLTEEKIISALDGLKATLRKEQDAFALKAQQFAAREISGRSDRITEITGQITQLQQELSRLSTELVDAQGKAARAQGQFTAAVERRSNEIEQQKAQVSALLK